MGLKNNFLITQNNLSNSKQYFLTEINKCSLTIKLIYTNYFTDSIDKAERNPSALSLFKHWIEN